MKKINKEGTRGFGKISSSIFKREEAILCQKLV